MLTDLFLSGYYSVDKENACASKGSHEITHTPAASNTTKNNTPNAKLNILSSISSSVSKSINGDQGGSGIKKRPLFSRSCNESNHDAAETSSVSATPCSSGPSQKKSKLIEPTTADTANESKSDRENSYPESFKSYLEELSDGFKSDVKELFENSIRVFDHSLKFLIPTSFTNSKGESIDSLQELELKEGKSTPVVPNLGFSGDPRNAANRKVPPISKKLSQEEQAVKQQQLDAALRMRCPSMWDKKEALSFVPSSNKSIATEALHAETVPSSSSSKQLTKDKKISLTKLYNNDSISYFPCDDDKILIIGNKRLMLVSKDKIESAHGNVEWCENVADVDRCNMSFQSK